MSSYKTTSQQTPQVLPSVFNRAKYHLLYCIFPTARTAKHYLPQTTISISNQKSRATISIIVSREHNQTTCLQVSSSTTKYILAISNEIWDNMWLSVVHMGLSQGQHTSNNGKNMLVCCAVIVPKQCNILSD